MRNWPKPICKLRKIYGDLKIAWKFTLAFFIILALPIIITGIYLSRTTSQSINQQAELLVEQSLIQMREMVHQKTQSIERTSIAITQNPHILKYFGDPFEYNRKGYESYIYYFSPLYSSYIIQNRYIHHSLVYVANTSFPDAWNGIYHLDRIESEEQYKLFLEDRALLQQWNPLRDSMMEQYIKTAVKEKVFTFSRKLISFSDDRCIGILEIEIAAKTLFNNFSMDASVVDSYFVIDDSGNIVSEDISESIAISLRAELINMIDENGSLDQIIKHDNEHFIIKSIPIDGIGCRLVGITPLSAFMAEGLDYRLVIPLVIIVALIFFGFLINYVANRLTGRLKSLVEGIKSVREKHINIKMPVDNKDEVGELTESFNHMTDRIHDLIERVYKAQIMEKESALKALQAQINPHFLYNTLSTMSWMAREIKADNIDHLAFMLSKFYRLVLSKGNSIIKVGDEIELLKTYIEIEQIRSDDLFSVIYDLDETAFHFKTVKIILQPIAENAIHHGIAPKGEKGKLVVRLRQDEVNLYFSIIDNGVGMSKDTLAGIAQGKTADKRDNGYAIHNVRERIQSVYGPEGIISIDSQLGQGTTVNIIIPKESMFFNL